MSQCMVANGWLPAAAGVVCLLFVSYDCCTGTLSFRGVSLRATPGRRRADGR